jgi:cytochrome d ubiquinol oxidase subunit I
VLGSIAMFSLVYILLFAVWVFVLDHKIRGGPDEVHAPPEAGEGGLLERAGRARGEPGASLTAAGPKED